MGNPFTPDPLPRDNAKYLDRAALLGDSGRAARREAEPETDEFQALLEGEVDEAETEELPDPAKLEDLEDAMAEGAAVARGLDLRRDAGELEAHREREGREETEKRLGSSWHGPDASAGLPAAAAALGLMAAGQVQRGERPWGGHRAAMRIEIRPGEARVDQELIQGLLDAGLKRPLTGLDDPRLAGGAPRMAPDDGWRESPTAKGIAARWEAPGRTAYQRVEWSEGYLLLETAAGRKLQTLERQGTQIFVRHAARDVPPAFPV